MADLVKAYIAATIAGDVAEMTRLHQEIKALDAQNKAE